MGSSGDIIIALRADWDTNCPEVKPSDIGLREGVVLGASAVWSYNGSNVDWPNHLDGYATDSGEDFKRFGREWSDTKKAYVPVPKDVWQARKAAATWFSENAESHELWT